MDFVRLKPKTEGQECRRKRLVLFLVVAVAVVIFVSLFNLHILISFLKTKPGIALIVACISALIYAHIEPFFLSYSFNEIIIPKKFAAFTAVQITDVHFQWPYNYVTKQKLMKIVEKVNSFNPDFVFLTGDYISRYRTHSISEHNTKTVSFYLGQLKAKHGVYAILGNNDRCCGNMLIEEFKRNGIRLLRNETVIEGDISITGLASSLTIEKCKANLRATKLENAPLRLCLVHEPDTAEITNTHFDLQLSGHTHGGQCIAPFGIGPIFSPKMGKKYIVGAYQIGNMILYVSTGVGISPLFKPLVRFNNIPEVSVIRVVPQE